MTDSKIKLRSSWSNMWATIANAERRGGGIPICSTWSNFSTFYADVGDPPSPAHILRRIDLKAGFFPENMAWLMRSATEAYSREAFQARILEKVRAANARTVE